MSALLFLTDLASVATRHGGVFPRLDPVSLPRPVEDRSGEIGEVHLAPDTSELGRTVALETLPATAMRDKDRLQRFTPEARTVCNLNHTNVLTAVEGRSCVSARQ